MKKETAQSSKGAVKKQRAVTTRRQQLERDLRQEEHSVTIRGKELTLMNCLLMKACLNGHGKHSVTIRLLLVIGLLMN